MIIPLYARVRLLTQKFRPEGLEHGSIGYVIEIYEDAYEVEFSNEQGVTLAQVVARGDELAVCDEAAPPQT